MILIALHNFIVIYSQGFRQECLKGGVQEGWGIWGSSPRRKKIRVFKFWCLTWPILTEMTVKNGKYFYFSCQQAGVNPPPPVVLSGGIRTPPGPPLAETLIHIILKHIQNVIILFPNISLLCFKLPSGPVFRENKKCCDL